jgi:hypothetical protein
MRFNIHIPRDLRAWPTWGVRIVRNALIDLHYGGLLGGELKSRFSDRHAVETANSDYVGMSYMFEGRIKDSDVLVDVGCGRGRVINSWLHSGYRNLMIGLELDDEVAERTRRRLRKFDNVTIITGDAVENIPPSGTLFYMYHPFGEPVMEAFKNRLKSMFDRDSGITILYFLPRHVDVFRRDPAWTVETVEVGGKSAYTFHPLAVIKMN